MPTPKTLLINGATATVLVWGAPVRGLLTCSASLNGVAEEYRLPAEFGPGHVVNLNSLFIQWGS